MRRALVVGLLAAFFASSCTGVSGDPWERVEALEIEVSAYLLAADQFEYDVYGVLTRSSLERWDEALFSLEKAKSDWSRYGAALKGRPFQVIRDFDLALWGVIHYSRFIVDQSKQCHADADGSDAWRCIRLVRNTYDEDLREALLALDDALDGLAEDASIKAKEDGSP